LIDWLTMVDSFKEVRTFVKK